MRFSCNKCKAQYTVADEKIRNRVIKIRCKRCSQLLVIRGRTPTPPPAAGPEKGRELIKDAGMDLEFEQAFRGIFDGAVAGEAPAVGGKSPSGTEWYCGLDGAQEGPLSLSDLEEGIRTGWITVNHFVWRNGMKDWVPVEDVPELVSLLDVPRPAPDATHQAIRARHQREREKAALRRREAEEPRADKSESLPFPPVVELDAIELDVAELEADGVAEVIAMQAGIGSERRRIWLGLTAVGLLVAAVGGLMALAFTQGWFKDRTEVQPGARGASKSGGPGAGPADYGTISDKDANRIYDSLWVIESEKRPGARTVGKPGRRRRGQPAQKLKLTDEEKDLAAFYKNQSAEKKEIAPRVPRGMPTEAMNIDFHAGSSGPIDLPLPEKAKVEIAPGVPERIQGPRRLTDVQIRLVIRRHHRQVKKCLERQLKRDPNVSGKLLVVARVKPDGKVQRVSIQPEKFHGTYLEECLIHEVGRWTFPSFDGEPYDLTFPYSFSAQVNY